MAGITIFGILGNLAYNMQIDDISSVVKSGTGLAFGKYVPNHNNFFLDRNNNCF